MKPYTVFLRGVNVGGKNRLPMPDLRQVLLKNNYTGAGTYINSGNIVLKSVNTPEFIKQNIRDIIKINFNLNVEVFVKTDREIKSIIENDPFAGRENIDSSKKCILILSDRPDKTKIKGLNQVSSLDDEYYFYNDIIYIYYVNGQSQSKFTNSLIEKKLMLFSTLRNWNTLEKLYEMISITHGFS